MTVSFLQHVLSFPHRRESTGQFANWIPAFAGMTIEIGRFGSIINNQQSIINNRPRYGKKKKIDSTRFIGYKNGREKLD